MQEARIVHLLQPVEQRAQDAFDVGAVERRPCLDAALQRVAAQHLHDDVGGAVGFEEVKDPHDARRVMQAGQRAAFGDEAVATPGEILGDLGRARQHGPAVGTVGQQGRQVFLDRDLAVELAVAGTIGDAEAALAQHGQHLVSPDPGARLQRNDIGIRRMLCPVGLLLRHDA